MASMITDEGIVGLCNQLQHAGSAVIVAESTKLAFVASDILSFAGNRPAQRMILVAWEGKGAFFWTVGDRVSTFLLIETGFSLRVAPTLADILNRVATELASREGDVERGATPLLEARNGPREEEN